MTMLSVFSPPALSLRAQPKCYPSGSVYRALVFSGRASFHAFTCLALHLRHGHIMVSRDCAGLMAPQKSPHPLCHCVTKQSINHSINKPSNVRSRFAASGSTQMASSAHLPHIRPFHRGQQVNHWQQRRKASLYQLPHAIVVGDQVAPSLPYLLP